MDATMDRPVEKSTPCLPLWYHRSRESFHLLPHGEDAGERGWRRLFRRFLSKRSAARGVFSYDLESYRKNFDEGGKGDNEPSK
ncbi:unnamed protein product [Spirodela intermedia]|uniref:Uncharacterized protein n=1 Tax=Spirodela intermedia TaxID=51605 RepID=A0A7I8IH46_SPIIN|nr:unnamed protein product [Spirodela intermedia]CAA6657205.1 unnamed protein product [Spirodela intermedia]